MLGAIIGDTAGSVYEFNNIKTTDFPFFINQSIYTDDSVMSFAVADWLLHDRDHTQPALEETMVRIAQDFPCPMGGYGGSFSTSRTPSGWLSRLAATATRWHASPAASPKRSTRRSRKKSSNRCGNGCRNASGKS